ncbi:MAG TPA: Hsp20/alpha crystallin family protein [Spirochaetota bacterium]|nr:Hsp20/alpha crystallin family protein [Spirochaetota bacterium]HOM38790.1 Hsp20/alpha crystallin family protein [Spirochaetota bacterium]HPQ49848.1 Hsp20/alpha crystallin family protein [Spirochaetota bacterium]
MWLLPDLNIIEKDFGELYREMNRFFEDRIREYSTNLIPINIYEDKNGDIKLIVPAPGIDKDKINIEYKDNNIYIGIEKNKNIDSQKIIYRRDERISGKLERIIELQDIDPDTIKANYENGILTISMKRKEGIVKKIKIE